MLNAALCRRTVYVSTFSVLHCYMLHSDSNRLMIYMICMLRAAGTQVYVYVCVRVRICYTLPTTFEDAIQTASWCVHVICCRDICDLMDIR